MDPEIFGLLLVLFSGIVGVVVHTVITNKERRARRSQVAGAKPGH